MRCPGCRESDRDHVIDSRMTEGGSVIRRRRECAACRRRFTTKERVEEELRLTVIKRDGSRVAYDRDKIRNGVATACYKLPVGDAEIDRLIDDVEGDIFAGFDKQITTAQIGELLMRRLRSLNAVAFVRFAAVFRQYQDVAQFVDEVQQVKELAAIQDPEQASLFEDE